MPARDWLTDHQRDKEWDGLATASVVFNHDGKVLLIQRPKHDSMPNRWEGPGGACDDEDPTILHGAARELWEEVGLVAKRFTPLVTDGPDPEIGQVLPNRIGQVLPNRIGQVLLNSTRTKTWCRFYYLVWRKRTPGCKHIVVAVPV